MQFKCWYESFSILATSWTLNFFSMRWGHKWMCISYCASEAKGARRTYQHWPKQTRGLQDLGGLCLLLLTCTHTCTYFCIYVRVCACVSKNDPVAFCPVRWELKGSAGGDPCPWAELISACQNILFFLQPVGPTLVSAWHIEIKPQWVDCRYHSHCACLPFSFPGAKSSVGDSMVPPRVACGLARSVISPH